VFCVSGPAADVPWVLYSRAPPELLLSCVCNSTQAPSQDYATRLCATNARAAPISEDHDLAG
jgi:hypothetical protein